MFIVQIIKTPFVQNLFATLIGAFFGFFLAFAANARDARKVKRRRESNFLIALRETLKDVKISVESISRNPKSAWVVPVNMTLLQSTASVKYEIIEDLEINQKLDFILNLLIQLSNLALMYQRAISVPQSSFDSAYVDLDALQDTIESLCKGALGPNGINDALERIEEIL